MTPLLKAASTGLTDVVKVLCAAGADITVVNNRGCNLLWLAWKNSQSMFQYVSTLRDWNGNQLQWVEPEPKDWSDSRTEDNFSKHYRYRGAG